MNISEIADIIVNALKKEGFIIQRYNAYSSQSIYLKLDYGVCYSIRISDHPGKRYLAYRYNIGPDIPEYYEDFSAHTRYYYNISDYEKLLDRILSDKAEKMKIYGEKSYKEFMWKNQKSRNNNKGFWKSAVLV